MTQWNKRLKLPREILFSLRKDNIRFGEVIAEQTNSL